MAGTTPCGLHVSSEGLSTRGFMALPIVRGFRLGISVADCRLKAERAELWKLKMCKI